MKLNCDLGEGIGSVLDLDEQVMPYIDQANIACGFHAGDPVIMANTLACAKNHKVEIGAHPGYPDLQGFGRRSVTMSSTELTHCVQYQISALAGMASIQGMTLTYVKPHGALYNDMMQHTEIRQVIMKAIADMPLDLSLMLQSTLDFEHHQYEAKKFALPLIFEAFADRGYDDHGRLVSRHLPYAIHDKTAMLEQFSFLLQKKPITTINGKTLSFPVETICVHGDNQTAVDHIQHIRTLMKQHEI